jgi:D-serine deaminase-like pyridoxal phosphate-dependent protein
MNHMEAKALVKRMHDLWEAVQANMAQSQQQYAKQANKHCRVVDFGVGDKVWVIIKHWKNDWPSKKLA